MKRKIESEETTRWNINEWPKWWRSVCDWRKRWRSSHDTRRNNGTNICCVGRWWWFITIGKLHARNKCRAYAWRALFRHEGRELRVYCSTCMCGNNNRLLFITPAPNARNVTFFISSRLVPRFAFSLIFSLSMKLSSAVFLKKSSVFKKSYRWTPIINIYNIGEQWIYIIWQ